MTKKLSPRAARRAKERLDAKLAAQREKLAALEDGGSPAHPVEVESSSQIEVHARALRCPRCDGEYRVDEHTAETVDGARLRRVRARCAACGARRDVWFRIATAMAN